VTGNTRYPKDEDNNPANATLIMDVRETRYFMDSSAVLGLL
jgi:hypothetical protein